MDGPEKQAVDTHFKKIEANDKKIQQLNDEVTQLINYTNVMDSNMDRKTKECSRLQKENSDLKKIIQQYGADKLKSEENLFAKLNSVEKRSIQRGTDSSNKKFSNKNVKAEVVINLEERRATDLNKLSKESIKKAKSSRDAMVDKPEVDKLGGEWGWWIRPPLSAPKMNIEGKHTRIKRPVLEKKKRKTSDEKHMWTLPADGASKMNVGVKNTRIEKPVSEKKKRKTSDEKHSARRNLDRSWFNNCAEGRFECKKCGKKCWSSEELSNHSLTHTFKCEICGKLFMSSQSLSKHSLIHTNPFECHECGKKFCSSLSLSNHSITHTNQFQCQKCGKRLSSSTTLHNHSLNCNGKQGFTCRKCGKKLSSSTTLHNHSLKCIGKKRFGVW